MRHTPRHSQDQCSIRQPRAVHSALTQDDTKIPALTNRDSGLQRLQQVLGGLYGQGALWALCSLSWHANQRGDPFWTAGLVPTNSKELHPIDKYCRLTEWRVAI